MGRSPNKTRRATKPSKRRNAPRTAKAAAKRAGKNATKPARRRAAKQASVKTEVARLSRELNDALAQQTATSEVLEVISSSMGDVQPVFEQMLEKATRVCGAEFGIMGLFGGEMYRRVALYNVPPAFAAGMPKEFRVDPEGAIGTARQTAQVFKTDDLSRSDWYLSGRSPTVRGMVELAGVRTLVIVPMLKDGEAIGVISIYRQEVRPFTDRQIELLKNFANQAVIVVENARLFNETREALARQTATAGILSAISSSVSDTRPVFDAILRSIEHLFGGEERIIFLAGEDGLLHIAALHSDEEERLRAIFPVPVEGTASEQALRERRVITYGDVYNDPNVPPGLREVARRYGRNYSLAIAPMLRGGYGIGSILVSRLGVSRRPFTETECDLLRSFADQAVIAIENARLFNETKEALARQTATSEVLQVISSSPGDLKPVFEQMLAKAMRLCEAQCGFIYQGEQGAMRAVAEIGVPRAFAEYRRQHLHTGGAATPIDVMRATRKPAHVHDARDSEPYRSGNPNAVAGVDLGGARTVLYVPMIRNDDIVGVINLYRQEVKPFTDEQIALLENFASQAVIAIENARLFNETKEALAQQTATSEVLQVISSSMGDAQPVFEKMLENAARVCGAEFGIMGLFDGDVYRRVALYNVPPTFLAVAPHDFRVSDQGPIGSVRHTGQIFRADDFRQSEAYLTGYAPSVAMVDAAGVRTLVIVPMLRDGKTIGVISIYRTEVRPFSDRQIELLRNFANQAVIAIENARLFNETKEALERQTATADILKVIAASPDDVQPVFQAIAERSNQLLNGLSTAVYSLVDDMQHLMAFTPVNAAADAALQSMFPRPLSAVFWSEAVLKGEILRIADADTELAKLPAMRKLARLRGWRSALIVPLVRDRKSIGLISVTRVEPGSFADHHVELLRTFADQAVIAIQNTRLFNETREALARQTATADVLKVIASSPSNLQPVFDAIAERSKALVGGHSTTVIRYVDGMAELAAYTPVNPEADAALRAIFPRPIEVIPQTELVRGGEVAQIADFELEALDPRVKNMARMRGFRSRIFVPLKGDAGVIGHISVTRKEPGAFADKDVELLKTFADQAVIAIQNVELFEEVQARTTELTESLEQQTATSEVLQVISSSQGKLEPVFQKMLEKATHVCGANFGTMNLWDGESVNIAASYNVPPAFAAWRQRTPIRPHPESGLAIVIRTHHAAHVHDLRDGPAYLARDPANVAMVEIAGARTIVTVPMLKENTLIGTMSIFRQEVRPFTAKQIALVENFTKQAVIAIENARLLNELRERTRQLSQSLDNLRAAQDRLIQTEKLASLGQLTAGIAHEIKNPLNFVNNFSALSVELTDELNDVLKQAELAGKIRGEVGELTQLLKSNLEKVVQHGKRADSIVKNMLLHSREGSGEQRAADVNALVEESLNLAYHGARAEKSGFNITLQREFDASAGEAELFPQEMTRALLNLISNGFYAATRRKAENGEAGFEPTLLATTKNLGSSVEIRIRDNGIGIPPEVRQKMFNPFFTTKPAGEGTGLGLSMTHDIIVKQHGGTIDVATESGHFTEFIVVLPRASNVQNKGKGQA